MQHQHGRAHPEIPVGRGIDFHIPPFSHFIYWIWSFGQFAIFKEPSVSPIENVQPCLVDLKGMGGIEGGMDTMEGQTICCRPNGMGAFLGVLLLVLVIIIVIFVC
jgi:hypothetical protein